MGWGGKRRGAGAKKKARVLAHPSVPPTTNGDSPVEEFDAPDDLLKEERDVWLKQAPHAFANRTLTKQSALSFERYCKLVVSERSLARTAAGSADHRGLVKLVNDLEKQFSLVPDAKGAPLAPVVPVQDEKPASKLDRFRRSQA